MFYNTLHRFLRLSIATRITTVVKTQNALRLIYSMSILVRKTTKQSVLKSMFTKFLAIQLLNQFTAFGVRQICLMVGGLGFISLRGLQISLRRFGFLEWLSAFWVLTSLIRFDILTLRLVFRVSSVCGGL